MKVDSACYSYKTSVVINSVSATFDSPADTLLASLDVPTWVLTVAPDTYSSGASEDFQGLVLVWEVEVTYAGETVKIPFSIYISYDDKASCDARKIWPMVLGHDDKFNRANTLVYDMEVDNYGILLSGWSYVGSDYSSWMDNGYNSSPQTYFSYLSHQGEPLWV
jgi:hypothetical protein